MKKIMFIIVSLSAVAMFGFSSLEPTVADAASGYATTTASLVVDSEIALTGCGAITMSPNIGLSQDSANGSTTCTVETSNITGYAMTVRATSSPALVSGVNSFADYGTSSPSAWSVGASAYKFGFSLFGTDVNSTLWGAGSTCGTAGAGAFSADGTMKYMGFNTAATTTSSRVIATPSAINTTICVAAEQGDSANAPSGAYSATIVVTAATQ